MGFRDTNTYGRELERYGHRWGSFNIHCPSGLDADELYLALERIRNKRWYDDDAPRNLRLRSIEDDGNLAPLLKFLDKKYKFGNFYYPGSGFNKVPKETLGEDRVVHLSNEIGENGEECIYFDKLDSGIKVRGDYRHSPFKDRSFDATLIWGTPPESTIEAMDEFRRVTKDDGLIIFGNSQFTGGEMVTSTILGLLCERVDIPERFYRIEVYQNRPIGHNSR